MKLLFFGPLRELIGKEEVNVEKHCTVGELKSFVADSYPQAAELLKSCTVVVNLEYADDDEEIHTHEQVGFIPPVSSG